MIDFNFEDVELVNPEDPFCSEYHNDLASMKKCIRAIEADSIRIMQQYLDRDLLIHILKTEY